MEQASDSGKLYSIVRNKERRLKGLKGFSKLIMNDSKEN